MHRVKDARKFRRAFNAHERSKRALEKAKSDIERFTTYLYGALKFQEQAVAQYNVTAKRLTKEHGGK